jgi:hypothetical protein
MGDQLKIEADGVRFNDRHYSLAAMFDVFSEHERLKAKCNPEGKVWRDYATGDIKFTEPVVAVMSKTTDDAYERAASGTLVETPSASFFADRSLGDVVYLKVRDEPVRGMITGIEIDPRGISYLVTWANQAGELRHYSIELTDERPL